MKRDYPFTVAVVLLAIVLLAIAMILWQRDKANRATIGELRDRIEAEAEQQTQQGGAETTTPEIEPSTEEYRFPIAPEDYRRLTSPFGYRLSPVAHVERYHNGLDIAATWRAQVVAIADGEVVEHWPAPDGHYRGHDVYGGMLIIKHANGWRSVYAHLSDTRVHTGWTVEAGEVIGRVGDTGQSDGQHLHFELHDASGRAVNALLYLEQVTGD